LFSCIRLQCRTRWAQLHTVAQSERSKGCEGTKRMKSLQKNQGRTDQMLGAMADMLTSVAMPNQQLLSEGGEADLPSSEAEKGPVQGQWDQDGPEWEQQAMTTQKSEGSEKTGKT
ncbi:hypothetical protein XENORESO_012634, partial [Xenotaenia resolanae]